MREETVSDPTAARPPASGYLALLVRNARRLDFPPEYSRLLASVPLKGR